MAELAFTTRIPLAVMFVMGKKAVGEPNCDAKPYQGMLRDDLLEVIGREGVL